MTRYRILVFESGRVIEVEDLFCPDEEAAMQRLSELCADRRAELWVGGRRLAVRPGPSLVEA